MKIYCTVFEQTVDWWLFFVMIASDKIKHPTCGKRSD